MTRFFRLAVALAALAASEAAFSLNHEQVVAPIAAGPFPVACSNIEQDTSRMIAGSVPADYWEGRLVNEQLLYVTQILSAPQTAVVYDAIPPDDRGLYPNIANSRVPFLAIVCHPTTASNTDPDYALPGGVGVVPRMQRPGQTPKVLGQPLPLVIYSHGLGGSPVGKGYIESLVALASYGYVVAAPFHADNRFSRVRIENLNDFVYLLTQYDRVAEMMAVRPVALKTLVDVLLAHPGFGAAIDPARIAGFGASLGGQAMINLMGAKLTTSIGLACRETMRDPRIKVAVGYVPYSGQTFLPAFCDDQSGADFVERPFLAIAGTADTTAPIKMTQQAVNRFKGSRFMVELVDGQHELRPEDGGDLFTWMVTFYRAYLQDDPAAMAAFIRMRGVAGGRDDNLKIDAHIPANVAPGEVRVIEVRKGDRFFLAESAAEVASLQPLGYSPTGHAFKAWLTIPPIAETNCHYESAVVAGSAVFRSCGWTRRLGIWTVLDESGGFFIEKADANGECRAGLLQVNRLYLPRFALTRGGASQRLVTSDSAAKEMVANGWILLPATMCARP
jgi:fermentation-respiration switch protein FrsA (DUF1100 family)